MQPASAIIDQAVSRLMSCQGEGGIAPGTPGYCAPHFATTARIFAAEDQAALARYGITLEGDAGDDTLICLDEAQPPLALTLRVRGCTGTRIVIGTSQPFGGRFAFNGAGSVLVAAGIGQMGGASNLRLTLGPGCAAYLGRGLTSVSSDWILEGEGRSLVIGDDLMASWGVSARNFDSHALFDLDERRVINSPANLHLGPHCWIGQDAKLVRGVRVGAGAVIGTGAIVTADVPPASAVAGSPARVVRSNISWTRNPHPSAAEMERIAALLARTAS